MAAAYHPSEMESRLLGWYCADCSLTNLEAPQSSATSRAVTGFDYQRNLRIDDHETFGLTLTFLLPLASLVGCGGGATSSSSGRVNDGQAAVTLILHPPEQLSYRAAPTTWSQPRPKLSSTYSQTSGMFSRSSMPHSQISLRTKGKGFLI